MRNILCYEDYIFTTKCDLDLDAMANSCKIMEQFVMQTFSQQEGAEGFNAEAPQTSPWFVKYNLMMYGLPEFYNLYMTVREVFRGLTQSTEPHYVQCWVNIYGKGKFIDWHAHWPPESRSWHGFVCVDCEPSKTSYRLPDGKQVDIPSENNLMVISPSNGDEHRTWPWEDETKPRITVAFDIVPATSINFFMHLNHWIPI